MRTEPKAIGDTLDYIKAEGLKKEYPGGLTALKSLNFGLSRKISAVLGHNGAGKTTLLRILSTQLLPSSGNASVLGMDIYENAQEIRERIVSIPQESDALEVLTPQEHLEMYLSARGISSREASESIDSALKTVGLYEARNQTANTLSGGMKRKIFVAMALASNADLTFLDEPTTGLDPVSRMEVWSAIKKLRGGVILTTHYLEEAKFLADEVMILNSGRLIAKGEIDSLLKPYKHLVRIDGIMEGKRSFKIGDIMISYLGEKAALEYMKKGYQPKQLGLEDLFILGALK